MDNREHIQKTIDYIEDNLKADITIEDLCRIAGYSYVHFYRLFHHFLGLTPSEFITRRKLLNAVYDIANGKSSIDVALEYGFETYGGFYKAFRREFNCSPTKFRKDKQQEKPYRINILQKEHIMISKTKIKKLLSNWNLQNEPVFNIYNENTNIQNENAYYIGNDYVIKFTANLAQIKNNIEINKVLQKSGLPVAKILKTIDETDYIQSGELYFIVTKRIKGMPLLCKDIFANTDLSIIIGENIAKLHNALKKLDEENYSHTDLLNDVKHNLSEISKSINIGDDFFNDFEALYSKLPKQIIHRDINPSNMLFKEDIFKGFIDFDLTEINIRIFDICYPATAILSECFLSDEIDKTKWTEIFHKLIFGYEKINPLTDEEKQALPYVIYAIQIICIAYFSRFDQYKNLAETNKDMLKWLYNSGCIFLLN